MILIGRKMTCGWKDLPCKVSSMSTEMPDVYTNTRFHQHMNLSTVCVNRSAAKTLDIAYINSWKVVSARMPLPKVLEILYDVNMHCLFDLRFCAYKCSVRCVLCSNIFDETCVSM